MSMGSHRARAVRGLVLCNGLWGISFPALKAMTLAQRAALPHTGTWFLSSLTVCVRFAVAALMLLATPGVQGRRITRLELLQGAGLGVFAAGGILFQMDGLSYTSASTSAFLTQGSCVFIPIWIAIRERRFPGPILLWGCVLAVSGVAILAEVDWETLRLGRGEFETLIASVMFTGQILWLERPQFRPNNPDHASLVMFAVVALVCAPVAAATTVRASDWFRAWQSVPVAVWMTLVVVLCTFAAFRLMNRWQRHLSATEAGLIYCLEPVFASAYALFLPSLFSRWSGIDYPNERLTFNLALGGGLITLANVLVQLAALRFPARAHSAGGRKGIDSTE